MAKTIQEQIAEMEARCNQLEELHKLFEKMVKNEYGIDAKQLKNMLKKQKTLSNDFEKRISSYFGLKSDKDYQDFVSVFCTKNSLDFFKKKRFKDDLPTAE